MLKKLLCAGLCLAVLLCCTACAGSSDDSSSTPDSKTAVVYGCHPQNNIPPMAGSLAVTSGDHVFYKNQSDGALYSANTDLSQPKKLADGPITGINVLDGFVYFTVATGTAQDTPISYINRMETNGSELTTLVATESHLSSLLIANNVLFCLSSKDNHSDLIRCTLEGAVLETIVSSPYTVKSFVVAADTIFFTGDYTPENAYDTMPDAQYQYTVFSSKLNGTEIADAGFIRGGNLFIHNQQLYSLVLYAANGFFFESLNETNRESERVLDNWGIPFVWALCYDDDLLYVCTDKSRNIRRLNLSTGDVTSLYDEGNTDEVYFRSISSTGKALILIDSAGKQYSAALGGESLSLSNFPADS